MSCEGDVDNFWDVGDDEGDCDGTGGKSVWFDDKGNDEGDGEGTVVRIWPTLLIQQGLHLGGQPIQIEVGGGKWPVLEPCHLRDQVGFRAHHTVHSEPFLALTDEEKAVIHEALMLYDFVDAANVSGSGDDIRVDDAEAEICLKECMHHDAVAELEDLQGEDGAGEEHQREREERKLNDVIGVGGVCVMLLGEGRGKAAESGIKLPAAVAENDEIEMMLMVH
ncbi:hypothetical protein LR48_Vigan01g045200 [Vigna angularis]|uniref:Uncharacterized protein n=1 Tax=Phaseolus angularis TaxID=3914 RepID=A0A0L9TKC7_PHAAN|nr:hypothetical protein LR48_Vigan01g045200 [Vigna angularis]